MEKIVAKSIKLSECKMQKTDKIKSVNYFNIIKA